MTKPSSCRSETCHLKRIKIKVTVWGFFYFDWEQMWQPCGDLKELWAIFEYGTKTPSKIPLREKFSLKLKHLFH